MQWFGPEKFGPFCDENPRADTPIGEHCTWCDEPIQSGDNGVQTPGTSGNAYAWHLECFLRTVIGGVNHLKGNCTCCGGTESPDDPGLSRRDAARAALKYRRGIAS